MAPILKQEPIHNGHFSDVSNIIKQFADSNFSINKSFSPVFARDDITILKNLSKDSSIIICRPDKGRGVVILNKTEYNSKMNTS